MTVYYTYCIVEETTGFQFGCEWLPCGWEVGAPIEYGPAPDGHTSYTVLSNDNAPAGTMEDPRSITLRRAV